MTLAVPEAAWLLLLLPFVWPLWRWRERHRPALYHPDMRFLTVVPTRRISWARWAPLLGRTLTLLLLILALMGPRWPVSGSRIPSEGIALVFVLDASGSMGENDVLFAGQPVTRLQAATGVIRRFLEGGDGFSYRGNDAVGLVTFAARPIDVCPPTLSHQSVKYFLEKAKPIGTVPDSSTNIGDAVGVAVDLLRRSPVKSKAIVLISDGEHTVPAELEPEALKPRQAAQLAAALGIRVHTIFLTGAVSSDATRQAERERAEKSLQSVAHMTQGTAASASDGTALQQVSQKLDAMEKARLQSFVYTDYYSLQPWLLAGALALLLGTILLEETWLRINP